VKTRKQGCVTLYDLFENTHFDLRIGVDEVGVSAIAGPLVACAYSPNKKIVDHLKDSKQLKPQERLQLAKELMNNGLYSLGIVPVEIINYYQNLNWCSKLAMIYALGPFLKFLKQNDKITARITIDFHNIPIRINGLTIALPKADEKYYEVAAASIIAKVFRDYMMIKIGYSMKNRYDFISNKGYKSKKHIQDILKYGPSKWHRKYLIEHLL
jgi:ribonuclease HII